MILQQTAFAQLNEITHPKPPMVSLADMCPFLSKHLHIALNQLAKKYGNIFQMRVGARNFVVLSGVETIKEALVKQQDTFNNRADLNIFQQPPQSEFLELKSGEAWKKHRDILMQVMHTFLAGNSDIHESWVTKEAEDLVDSFLNSSDQPFDPELYIPLATISFMQRLVFDKRGSVEDADLVKTAYSIKMLPNGFIKGIILDVLPKSWQPIFAFVHLNSAQAFIECLTAV